MEADFWLTRWRDGRTHFHQQKVQVLLQKYWPALNIEKGQRVFVPLCGKTLDMMWLAGQGHPVLGIDLSPLAAEQFFTENDLPFEQHASSLGQHYTGHCDGVPIEIICGDIFDLDAATLGSCAGVYDRAALIALPSAMRVDYVRHVYGALPASYQGLLITLDYPQAEMAGPPFSVPDADVQTLFSPHSRADILSRRDILAKEEKFLASGVSRLDTVVYQLSATPV